MTPQDEESCAVKFGWDYAQLFALRGFALAGCLLLYVLSIQPTS